MLYNRRLKRFLVAYEYVLLPTLKASVVIKRNCSLDLCTATVSFDCTRLV